MPRLRLLTLTLVLALSAPHISAQPPLTLREQRIAAVILRLDRLATLMQAQHRALQRELEALETAVEDLAK